jgi:drug/metabolite transporter (DMT)-like permease
MKQNPDEASIRTPSLTSKSSVAAGATKGYLCVIAAAILWAASGTIGKGLFADCFYAFYDFNGFNNLPLTAYC